MRVDNNQDTHIIAQGDLVVLRRISEDDRDHIARWHDQGEWRSYDAPWEERTPQAKPDKEKKKQEPKEKSPPKTDNRLIIATLDGIPLGWVSRYGKKKHTQVWYVGIDICEDAYLNRGYGTEALWLWVDHQFTDGEVHKICLDTWSFNPRMVHVAEKLGFTYEGSQREMQYWEGEWLDLMHFGMLREEWEGIRQNR
jgi:RimJ/RimL family protein N-acetyltransferase